MESGTVDVEYYPTSAFSPMEVHLSICDLCLCKAVTYKKLLLLLLHTQPQSLWRHSRSTAEVDQSTLTKVVC